jgi:antitoxin VapB
MDTAKLFKNGRSQAVRLPKQYSLPGEEVYVKKLSNIVMLIPKQADPWQPLIDSLENFSDDVFAFGRNQGKFEHRNKLR